MRHVNIGYIFRNLSLLLMLSFYRPMGSSYIHYAESSMKNGFGLKYLHKFFNIPFLQLQVIVLFYVLNIWFIFIYNIRFSNTIIFYYDLFIVMEDKAHLFHLSTCPGNHAMCLCAEGDPPEAAGDQPVGHGCDTGGALCPAGDWRSELWDVCSSLFSLTACALLLLSH